MTERLRAFTEPISDQGWEMQVGPDKVAIGYDIGSQSGKDENQDSYWPRKDKPGLDYLDYLIAGRLYVVADGVSRGLSGEQASQLATDTIADTYYRAIYRTTGYPRGDDVERALSEAIRETDQKLLDRSREQRAEAGLTDNKSYLQTTVICGLLRGRKLIVACVGDSRLYLLRKDDQEPSRFRVQLVSRDERGSNRYFVGSKLQSDSIWYYKRDVAPGDMLLLCSDGLYKYLAPDNDSEKAIDVVAESRPYYEGDGIEGLKEQLLNMANNPNRGGGGDNITVMIVEPPQQAHPDSLEPQDGDRAIENLVRTAWWDIDRPVDSTQGARETVRELLIRRCTGKASQLAHSGQIGESKKWERWAAGLGGISLGLDKVEKAQTLYTGLGLDFESNSAIVNEILKLFDQAPTNPQLRELSIKASTDLANVALLSPEDGGALWDVFRMFHTRILSMLVTDDERKHADQVLQQLSFRLAHLYLLSQAEDDSEDKIRTIQRRLERFIKRNSPKVFLLPYNRLIAALEKNRMPQRDHRIIRVILLALLDLIVLCIGCLVAAPATIHYLDLARAKIVTPQGSGGTSTPVAVQAQPSASGSVPITPTVTPDTVQVPTLTVDRISIDVRKIGDGRRHVKVTIPLHVEQAVPNPDAVIQTQTAHSAGLTVVKGGGVPEPQTSDPPNATVIQRALLENIAPQGTNFEQLYIVEWPHVKSPIYTITVSGGLVTPDGRQLAQLMPVTQVFTVEHRPALSVTQVITPDLVAVNGPITYHLTIRNTGETYLDRLEINWSASNIEAPFENTDEWQKQLDTVVDLEPGTVREVTIPTHATTSYPEFLQSLLAIDGILADGARVPSYSSPAQLAIYVRGESVTASCEGCYLFTALSATPGSAPNKKLKLPDGTEVKVLDAVQVDGTVWYYLETALDGKPERGWLWSKRVRLDDPTIEAYLKKKAGG